MVLVVLMMLMMMVVVQVDLSSISETDRVWLYNMLCCEDEVGGQESAVLTVKDAIREYLQIETRGGAREQVESTGTREKKKNKFTSVQRSWGRRDIRLCNYYLLVGGATFLLSYLPVLLLLLLYRRDDGDGGDSGMAAVPLLCLLAVSVVNPVLGLVRINAASINAKNCGIAVSYLWHNISKNKKHIVV